MAFVFEELDNQESPIGNISLRRRSDPRLGGKILFEVKLGEEFLMSSLFTEAEIQLSKLGIAALAAAGFEDQLDIIVGGLGLGYTAAAALEYSSVRSLIVIDVMEAVISWHQCGLVPLGNTLTSDPRCTLFHGDFFAIATADQCGFNMAQPEQLAHAVLLDIDHSPSEWLNPQNKRFYTAAALQSLSDKLHPGGIFGLWSNDPPDDNFMALLDSVFESSEAQRVFFPNPYKGGESSNTVYLAHKNLISA
ncbi:MAG: spermidine synthase [Lentisphaeria bacterium]|jgi:spermidine synthase